MSQTPNPSTPFGAGSLPFQAIDDPIPRGFRYLQHMQTLVMESMMVDIPSDASQRDRMCRWIGENIERINAQINGYVWDCHACFRAEERRSPIEIFAVPLSDSYGLDALCNVYRSPIAILVDVGRVVPRDWLRLVVHEYAHAHLGTPGHHDRFSAVINHLCLGLGLEPLPTDRDPDALVRRWPPYQASNNSKAFWMGGI